jgi:kynurenine formamidase
MASLIDLSVRAGPTPSEATPVEIDTLTHEAAPGVLGLAPTDFPGGMAISNETVTLTTHTGTHLDAPLHYGPECGGAPARSIDEVPLEWCIGPGVRLDVRNVAAGTAIGVADVAAALERAGHELGGGDIGLLWTGADQLWGSAAYRTQYPGLSGEATRFLVERGVRVIGIDAWGLDRPMAAMVDAYRRTGDRTELWPAHVLGREREYVQLEKLANLGALPGPAGFTVVCFPVSLAGVGAAWTRVVALIDQPGPGTA